MRNLMLTLASVLVLAACGGSKDDTKPGTDTSHDKDVVLDQKSDGTPADARVDGTEDNAPDVAKDNHVDDVAIHSGSAPLALDDQGRASSAVVVVGAAGSEATLPAGTAVVTDAGDPAVGSGSLVLEEPFPGFDEGPDGTTLLHTLRVGTDLAGGSIGAYYSTWTEELLDDPEAEPPTGLALRVSKDGLAPRALALLYQRVAAEEPEEGSDFVPEPGAGNWGLVGKAVADANGVATFQVFRSGVYGLAVPAVGGGNDRAQLWSLVHAFDKRVVTVVAVERSTSYVITAWTAPDDYWMDSFTPPETSEWFSTGSPDEPFDVRLENYGKTLHLRSEFANAADLRVSFQEGGEVWESELPWFVEDGELVDTVVDSYSDCDQRFATPVRLWVRTTCGTRKNHYKPRVLGPLKEHYPPYTAYTQFFKKIGDGYFAEVLVDTDECTSAPPGYTDLVLADFPSIEPESQKARDGRAFIWKTGCGVDGNPEDCFVPGCEAKECVDPARDCGCQDLVDGDFGSSAPVSCLHAAAGENLLALVGCSCRPECWFLGNCCADVEAVCDNKPVCDGTEKTLSNLLSEAKYPDVFANVADQCKPCHTEPLEHPELCDCGLCWVDAHPYNCWPEVCGCANNMAVAMENYGLDYPNWCDRTGMVTIDGKSFSNLKTPGGCYCHAGAVTTGYACTDICETCGYCPDCGDGHCGKGLGENCVNCPADCGPCTCGDYVCQGGAEDPTSCPQDCYCGDGLCQEEGGEDKDTCLSDCHCGDGTCDAPADNCFNCPADCGDCT